MGWNGELAEVVNELGNKIPKHIVLEKMIRDPTLIHLSLKGNKEIVSNRLDHSLLRKL